MPRDGGLTRERILNESEALVMNRGFSGTSIDNILAAAQVTKGSFFYHFKNKDELARALIDRFAARDRMLLEEIVTRAERLSRDPLQRLLILIGLIQEQAEIHGSRDSGCLFASYCYQKDLVPVESLETARQNMLLWRRTIKRMLKDVAAKYPPRLTVAFDTLADDLSAVVEGAFVMGITLRDDKALAQHVAHFKNYIELLFAREFDDVKTRHP